VTFIQTNAERLPFRSDSLHHMYGKAVLHHLDIDVSAREIRRLLNNGGRVTLAEPMAAHPLFWSARKLTPAFRTHDEHPLTCKELQQFMESFNRPHVEFFFFLTPLSYLFRVLPSGERLFQRIHNALHRLDQWLFAHIPWLTQFAWYDVVNVEVPSPNSKSVNAERQ
jgi:SAM-dependent methyltransferase